MFCPSCGTESQPDQRFCKGCGAALGALGNGESLSPVAAAPLVQAVPLPSQSQAQYQPSPVPIPYPQEQTPAQYPPPPVTTPYPQAPPPYPPPGPPMYQPYPGGPQQVYYMPVAAVPYRLFDSGAVLLATFFGSPLAGAILMAVNYGRLGKSGKGFLAAVLGLIATALLIAVGLSQNKGSSVLGIVFLLATWQVARMAQGKDVEEHTARGGQLGSKWTAFFIGVATLAVLFGVIFVAIYVNQSHNQTQTQTQTQTQAQTQTQTQTQNFVTIGTKDQVIYSGTATKDQATALGNALKADGYFQDQGATVLLDKETGGTTISYVVKDGFWNQAGVVAKFDELTREVASSVGGLPLNVQLVNDTKTVEKTSSVGSVAFGNDTVVYEGAASQAEAQALGQKLQSLGFLSGKGVDVLLGKHTGGTTIAFVVSDGVWNDANMVSGFEDIVRQAAPAVGGLPIKMLLLSTTLQKEKEEEIQ